METEKELTRSKIASMVKRWIANASYTEEGIAQYLGITQASLNAQLEGKNPFQSESLVKLVKKLEPSWRDVFLISTISNNSFSHDQEIQFLETEKDISVLRLERARIERKLNKKEKKLAQQCLDLIDI